MLVTRKEGDSKLIKVDNIDVVDIVDNVDNIDDVDIVDNDVDDIGDFGDAEGYAGPLQEGGGQQADRLGAQSRQR